MLSSRPISVHVDPNPSALGAMAFKTPRRGPQHRAENAATGRKQAFQTPFKQPFAGGPTTPFPGGGGKDGGKTAPRTVLRVLGDKTPFPNRARKSGGGGTPDPLAKLALETPGLRPSSSRTSVRRSGGGFDLAGLRALNLGAFQTPKVNGNPWDVEDVELAPPEADEGIVEEPADDYDEIEYMPPRAQELPWEPAFEMPDYKELGRALMSFAYTPRPEDEPAPPSFENDPEYERAVLDACVPPEPLCPATIPPLSFLTPPPTPPPVAKAGVAARKPITRTRSATATSSLPAAPIRRTATLAPKPSASNLAPKAPTLTRKPSTLAPKPPTLAPKTSSRTLAVPAGPSSRSTPAAPTRAGPSTRSTTAAKPTTTTAAPPRRTPSAAATRSTATSARPSPVPRPATVAARPLASSRPTLRSAGLRAAAPATVDAGPFAGVDMGAVEDFRFEIET